MHRCLVTSVLLVLCFTVLRALGVDPGKLRPFAPAAMCLGNIMYFLALLIMSGSYRRTKRHLIVNVIMVVSLVAAILFGSVLILPSMTNTATTFLVLWAMQKEIEVDWGGVGIVVLFMNFVGLYFIAHYLHTHPEHIYSMFNAEGVYM